MNKPKIITDINYFIENDLNFDIRSDGSIDDEDIYDGGEIKPFEMSDCNLFNLKQEFLSLKSSKKIKAIFEIGICRNKFRSSCFSYLENKDNDTYYFGVDIEDKSFLDNHAKNIYTIRNNSSNIEEIMNFINGFGVYEFDFIFIDGDHTLNQVLYDWRFTQFLSNNGVVGLHDTNFHRGPKIFVDNLDTNKFIIDKLCLDPSDWGITFIRKI